MNTGQRPTLEDLSRYVDGLAPEAEQEWIRSWLAEDESLANDLGLLDTLQDLVSEDIPDPEPRLFTDARAAILDQVKQEQRSTAPGSIPWLLQFFAPKRLVPLVAGACAVLFAIAVVTNPGDQEPPAEKGRMVAVNEPVVEETDDKGSESAPVELTPEQKEEAQAAVQMVASAAGWVNEETSGLRGTAAAQLSGARSYIENNGQALWQTGTDRVGDLAESILKTGKSSSEPITDWTVKQAQYQAGTSLLGLALGIV